MKFAPVQKAKQTLRESISGLGDFVGAALQFAVPGIGSAISIAVGKWVAGLILALISAAVLFRLLWRRKRADQVKQRVQLPLWKNALACLGALLGAGVLVEITDLPVRFHQPGFSMGYWLIVVVAVSLLYGWIRALLQPSPAPSSEVSLEMNQ